jgi:hypothetical protein
MAKVTRPSDDGDETWDEKTCGKKEPDKKKRRSTKRKKDMPADAVAPVMLLTRSEGTRIINALEGPMLKAMGALHKLRNGVEKDSKYDKKLRVIQAKLLQGIMKAEKVLDKKPESADVYFGKYTDEVPSETGLDDF